MDYTKPHIPIFIITHNRLEILKRCVDSYEKSISHPIRIIFFNVASTYQPTLDYIASKENSSNGATMKRTEKKGALALDAMVVVIAGILIRINPNPRKRVKRIK